MAVGDLEDGSSSCVHQLSYNSVNHSSNWQLPLPSHLLRIRESEFTSQSLQPSGSSQLTATHPSSATAKPTTGGHPGFKDEETCSPLTSEGDTAGGRPDSQYETDGAVGAIASPLEMNELLKSKPASDIIKMGFSSDVVKIVIHLKVTETGCDYTTAEALLDAVMAYQVAMSDEDSQGNEESNDRNSSSHHDTELDNVDHQNLSASDTTQQGNGVIRKKKKGKIKSQRNGRIAATGNQHESNYESPLFHTDSNDAEGNIPVQSQMLSPFLLKEENKKMKSSRKCKICQENEIRIVFLPCGHLICCSECISLVQNCTVCLRPVKGSVKVFLA